MAGGDILLCDLDAFYASVEQLDHPPLRGKPVLVGGARGTRGVVAACSYEARAFGVHSAMPMLTAKRLCPPAIIRPVNMQRYKEMSAAVIAIYQQFTPLIEVVSIDEAYLEVKRGRGMAAAAAIRQAVQQQLGLPLSIGISSNKLLAKISSNMAKPNGMQAIWPADAPQILGRHSVRILPGIGPKTAAVLQKYGVTTVAELANHPLSWFKAHFGVRGEEMFHYARWRDYRPLVLEREPKSIGKETTFWDDVEATEIILAAFQELSQEVGLRLRKAGYAARTLTIKLRFADFKTITRSNTPGWLLYNDGDLYSLALGLYNTLKIGKPLRLIGIQVSNLEQGMQLSLFDEEREKEMQLTKLIDRLNEKYGQKTIKRGI